MGKFCTKCGSKLDDDAVFCGECGARQEKSPQVEGNAAETSSPVIPYPKSVDLSQEGSIGSKLVCSCGSKEFISKTCFCGGISSSLEGYVNCEAFQYDYHCAKCGAEVYLLEKAEGDAYFCFVPKEQRAEAQKMAGAHEGRFCFTKSFFYNSRWGDLISMPDFTDTYAYLKNALYNPVKVEFYYSEFESDPEELLKIRNTMLKGLAEHFEDEELVGDYDESKGKALAEAKSGKPFFAQFGPGMSFAIDHAGKLILNDDAHFVPDQEAMAEKTDLSAFEKWREVLEAYIQLGNCHDEKVTVLGDLFYPDDKSLCLGEKMAKELELTGRAWRDLRTLVAVVDRKALGGTRMLIYRKNIWVQEKPLIGKANTYTIKLDVTAARTGVNVNEDDRGLYVFVEKDADAKRIPNVSSISPEAFKKLGNALDKHLKFRKWYLEKIQAPK